MIWHSNLKLSTSGVKQGDLLSVLLFSIVMDVIISKLEVRDNISTRLKQILTYANDIITVKPA
jgi:hypothetical protein